MKNHVVEVTGRRKVESLQDTHEFVEESFYELVEETSRLSTLLNSHPNIEYESGMETVDLLYRDTDQVEDKVDYQSKKAHEALKKMDAALLLFEEEVEDIDGAAKNELMEEKMWYRDKYLDLEEEIRNAEATPLLEEDTGKRSYDRPDFDIEKELETVEAQLEKADSRY